MPLKCGYLEGKRSGINFSNALEIKSICRHARGLRWHLRRRSTNRRKTSRYVAHEMTNWDRNNSIYNTQISILNPAVPTARDQICFSRSQHNKRTPIHKVSTYNFYVKFNHRSIIYNSSSKDIPLITSQKVSSVENDFVNKFINLAKKTCSRK